MKITKITITGIPFLKIVDTNDIAIIPTAGFSFRSNRPRDPVAFANFYCNGNLVHQTADVEGAIAAVEEIAMGVA